MKVLIIGGIGRHWRNRINVLKPVRRVAVCVLSIGISTAALPGQIRYRVTPVEEITGIPGATAINDLGQMTGSIPSTYRSYFYDGTKVVDVGTLGGDSTNTLGLNNAGQIVGVSSTASDAKSHAFLYADGGMSELDGLPGNNGTVALAINGKGEIAGRSNPPPAQFGVLWSGGRLIELGSLGGSFTYPAAINNTGQIVGHSYVVDFTPPHAFLYSDGRMFDLGTGDGFGSAANDINDRGQIVGFVDYPNSVRHAMLYSDWVMTDLGALGGPWSEALAINNDGVIVGSSYTTPVGGAHAFVYLDGQMLDLNEIADLAPAGVSVLNSAYAINNRGEILCSGHGTGASTSFLLTPVAGVTTNELKPSRLVNFSVRAAAGTEEETLILGFVTQGAGRLVLVRASGPALSPFGFAQVVPDPQVTLFNGPAAIAHNDDWGAGSDALTIADAFARAGAFPFPPESKDSALLFSTSSGGYTVHVGGNGAPAIALMEVYDAESGAGGSLVNASARGMVGIGEQTLIMGFVIDGDLPKTVLIRAVGPTLENFGLADGLTDPVLTVFGGGIPIATNDDWNSQSTADEVAAVAGRIGAFPLPTDSTDAAILATLPPGPYTIHVSGWDGGTGVILCEVYDADRNE